MNIGRLLVLMRRRRAFEAEHDVTATPNAVSLAFRVFFRGFLIVSLTASNVSQIANRHWLGAFLGGFAISFVWWKNSHTAAHTTVPYARELYALGAALGTVFGMWIVQEFYR